MTTTTQESILDVTTTTDLISIVLAVKLPMGSIFDPPDEIMRATGISHKRRYTDMGPRGALMVLMVVKWTKPYSVESVFDVSLMAPRNSVAKGDLAIYCSDRSNHWGHRLR